MSHQDTNMDGSFMSGDDAWLEELLRADAAKQPYIADDGFSSRVMSQLPAQHKPATQWIIPAATVLGAAAAVGFSSVGGYVANGLLGLLDIRHFSLAHLTVLVPIAVLYACAFGAAREH